MSSSSIMSSLPLDIIHHHILPYIPLDWIYVSKIFSQQATELLLTDSRVNPSKNDNEPIKKAAKLGLTKTFKMLMKDPRVDVFQALDEIGDFKRKDLFDLINWDEIITETTPKTSIRCAYGTATMLNCFESFRKLLELAYCDRSEEGTLIVDSAAFAYLARYDYSYNKEMVRYIFRLMGDQVPTEETYRYTDICRASVRSGHSEVYNLFRKFYYYDTLLSSAIVYKQMPLVEELLDSHMLSSISGDTILGWAFSSKDNTIIKAVLKKIDIAQLPWYIREQHYTTQAKKTQDEEIINMLTCTNKN